jgi:hypothetical protein
MSKFIFKDKTKVSHLRLCSVNEKKVKERYRTFAERTTGIFNGTIEELREYYKSLWISDNQEAGDHVKNLYIHKKHGIGNLVSKKVKSRRLEEAEQVKRNFPMFFREES